MAGDPLLIRAKAAREVIRQDPAVDRLEVLSLVVWPTAALASPPPAKRPVTAEEAARMAKLAAQGLSHYAIAEQVGRPRSTVSAVLRREAA